ncbi:MAG: Holliday junction branch migration protein RuvA [Elusimicrobia bacterium]|nr:Holliday junction branch migration protein RuvA [Elusimicrobiota bacterium]
MIAYLKGTLLEKGEEALILEAGGVGYEVHVSTGALLRAGEPGTPLELFISESIAMYGGGTTLYGFLHREEKELFLLLREVPATGAKKAIEYLDKAGKSLPDFRRAIMDGDARMLSGVFGFTSKTADKLISALKDKLAAAGASSNGVGRAHASHAQFAGGKARSLQQALDALISLGYKPAESRQTLQTITSELNGKDASVEEMIRLALKRL